jgi:hypothetical protein
MHSSKSPHFSPSGLSKHLRAGLVRMPHHILTTQTEPRGFIESSVQNKVVHIELISRLRFYLIRRLVGYTVGTTVGFPIETMDALDP